jgi:hypothetical protein
MENWLPVSASTDVDGTVDYPETVKPFSGWLK